MTRRESKAKPNQKPLEKRHCTHKKNALTNAKPTGNAVAKAQQKKVVAKDREPDPAETEPADEGCNVHDLHSKHGGDWPCCNETHMPHIDEAGERPDFDEDSMSGLPYTEEEYLEDMAGIEVEEADQDHFNDEGDLEYLRESKE